MTRQVRARDANGTKPSPDHARGQLSSRCIAGFGVKTRRILGLNDDPSADLTTARHTIRTVQTPWALRKHSWHTCVDPTSLWVG